MERTTSADFATTVAVRIAGKIRHLAPHLFDSYRPELHYMRGPGPKWQEKHGRVPATNNATELDLSRLSKAGA